MQKTALITGISGQDGSYLAELLLKKDYIVHGIVRRTSMGDWPRLDGLDGQLILHVGDVTDACNMQQIISRVRPDEVYNLAGQSDVGVSFECPLYTTSVNGIGVLNILEGIRTCGLVGACKMYQASTSELYGGLQEAPQSIHTAFYPRSPYSVSKLFGHWSVVNYREAYGLFAVNGILFNHESPRRGKYFVTQKIIKGIVDILSGSKESIVLGNLSSKRDWGHAKDYVRAMWLMLQQVEPRDFVICSGTQCSVRDFVSKAFAFVGITIFWEGDGICETGMWGDRIVVQVDEKYFRPTEVHSLLGCPQEAMQDLQWVPEYDIEYVIRDMMLSEMSRAHISYPLDITTIAGA